MVILKIKHLRIKNFQSIKDIEFEFDEKGVNRFSGPNNIGKSVVLKAIATIMLNVSNRYYKEFIRDEEDTFEIRLEDFEGNWVHLSRGAVDFYAWSINGEEGREDRTDGKVPVVLKKYFNLYNEEEKTKECLNIRLPDDSLLFVNTTPGDNAMMFQKALGTEDYMLGIKLVDKKGNEIKKEIKLENKYLEKETEKLTEAESDLQKTIKDVEELERYETILKTHKNKYVKILDMEESTEEVMLLRKYVKENKTALEEFNLNEIKDGLKELSKLETVIDLAEEVRDKGELIKDKNKTLSSIKVKELNKNIDIYRRIVESIDVYEDVSKIKNKLSKVVKVNVNSNDLQKDINLVSKINGVMEVVQNIKELTNKIKQGKDDYNKLNLEIKKIEKEMGHCPTCGTAFPHEH